MKAIKISLTALVCSLSLATAALADPPHAGRMTSNSSQVWTSGMYTYDGAGNIVGIGTDAYTYDLVGRLLTGTTDRQRSGNLNQQTFTYDAFGNRKTVTKTGGGCLNNVDCYQDVGINSATNRINTNSAVYDAAGNLTTIDGTSFNYEYDGAGMMSFESAAGADMEFIFTPNDERIATYQNGGWTFTPRDVSGKVLREVTAVQSGSTFGSWMWQKDHIWRDGILLATLTASGSQHVHLDHIGTPRLVTNDAGETIGIHSYYPFGAELALAPTETPLEALKFTGHERDTLTGAGAAHSLDYMHARNYSPGVGRFVSADIVSGRTDDAQSWNRYVYGRTSPLNYVDPDGNSYVVFVRSQYKISLYSSGDVLIGSWPASNFVTSDSNGPWRTGRFAMLDTTSPNFHSKKKDSPNGSYGPYGIFRARPFRDADGTIRDGMGIHSGRANAAGPCNPTRGCVRTDNDAMRAIVKTAAADPLTFIYVSDEQIDVSAGICDMPVCTWTVTEHPTMSGWTTISTLGNGPFGGLDALFSFGGVMFIDGVNVTGAFGGRVR
jgi:RHS repeat-associated protein